MNEVALLNPVASAPSHEKVVTECFVRHLRVDVLPKLLIAVGTFVWATPPERDYYLAWAASQVLEALIHFFLHKSVVSLWSVNLKMLL